VKERAFPRPGSPYDRNDLSPAYLKIQAP